MKRTLLWGLGLLVAAASQAHEGEVHRDDAASAAPLSAAALAQRPRRLPDGELYLPKAAQHLLGIRTQMWSASPPTAPVSLLAEVQAQPASAATISAPGPGQLEPPGDSAAEAWPLPGQAVHAGQVLAWLRPQISQRDAARRRAQVADLEQQLIIANLNVERLKMQGAVDADQKVNTGNIYLAEAEATRDALQSQRDLMANSLEDRVALRAQVSGTVLAAPARSGDVVATGQTLFQLADPTRLRLAVLGFDPTLGGRLRAAQIRLGNGPALQLTYRGVEPLPDAPGWRLLFDAVTQSSASGGDGAALSPGQLVEVQAQATTTDTAVPSGACAIDADGAAVVWVHRAPERFAPLRLKSCTSGLALDPAGTQLAAGDRLVTNGAGLLSQYR